MTARGAGIARDRSRGSGVAVDRLGHRHRDLRASRLSEHRRQAAHVAALPGASQEVRHLHGDVPQFNPRGVHSESRAPITVPMLLA